MLTLGLDTSNYTTSIAYFDGETGVNCSQLLPVQPGQLGLRQSDAVFSHTKSLTDVAAIAVSTRPRAVEGSYMPCFMVGYSHAKMLSDGLHVPLIQVSHQQGHVAACLWSAGRLDLMDRPHLAWHLSGGTTELLLVEPDGKNVKCTRIGGTTDISAGQLIDRTGVMMELPFPAGKHMDALAGECKDLFKVKCPELEFSLSGVQNKVQQYHQNHTQEETAAYCLNSVCFAVKKATENALAQYPGLEVVLSGGVASNSRLRQVMEPLGAVFGAPQYSTDNAMGVAILADRLK